MHSYSKYHFASIDTLYLIKWLEDEDFYNVIAVKDVVPPEDCDILDMTPGMICRLMFNSKLCCRSCDFNCCYEYIHNSGTY